MIQQLLFEKAEHPVASIPDLGNYRSLVDQGRLLPFERYDYVIVSYSGGKDSLALALLAREYMPESKVELWHQHVDGAPGVKGFMDWPCTASYCRATAKALEFPLRFQWKIGGFEAEMLRENSLTNGVAYEDGAGEVRVLPPSPNGKVGTRLMFPQVSADLSVRWCSSYLKIQVADRAINNDPRFKGAKILFLTGERREESAARAKYKEAQDHGCNSKARRVDQWRAVIDWPETLDWEIIERHKIVPHPAYRLGWGRVSCMACIFGDKDQWASVRKIASSTFKRIADFESRFGKTIKRKESVVQTADAGTAFAETEIDDLVRLAMSEDYPADAALVGDGNKWVLPAGAYKTAGGPT